MEKIDYKEAISTGLTNPHVIQCYGGCARIYVMAYGKEAAKKLQTAAKQAGLTFQKKAAYGLTNAMYIGYDTGSKTVYGQGEAVAANLRKLGIECYVEAGED